VVYVRQCRYQQVCVVVLVLMLTSVPMCVHLSHARDLMSRGWQWCTRKFDFHGTAPPIVWVAAVYCACETCMCLLCLLLSIIGGQVGLSSQQDRCPRLCGHSCVYVDSSNSSRCSCLCPEGLPSSVSKLLWSRLSLVVSNSSPPPLPHGP
jgi:hypothetical protein